MRNEGDKIVTEEVINKHKGLFRCLKEWRINYVEDKHKRFEGDWLTNGQCYIFAHKHYADIYPCPADIDIDEYVFHEMLHVAFWVASKSKINEEEFVQDICSILKGKKVAENVKNNECKNGSR